METLKPFIDVADDPGRYAAQWKQNKNGKVVGTFCSYAPEEIIWAAGALPYRIFGSDADISLADEHLQAYSCSLVRGSLEDALSGKLAFLDGTVFPHTCDSIQRLSDIWRLNAGFDFHVDAVLPVKLNTGSARSYMRSVLERFKNDLENALGIRIDDADLKRSAKTYNRIRDLLTRLYRIRCNAPSSLTSMDLYTLLKASMAMDRDDLVHCLEPLVEALEGASLTETEPQKRIVLSGGLCTMPNVYATINACGGHVVWDDLCTGGRYIDGRIDMEKPVMDALAERYVNRTVCPAKHSGLESRGGHLVSLVKENKAKGVIFLYLKFCDPHAFDYPYIKKMLEDENIPCLLFELEDRNALSEQFHTRCEAFLEML